MVFITIIQLSKQRTGEKLVEGIIIDSYTIQIT